jgi:predicted ATPase
MIRTLVFTKPYRGFQAFESFEFRRGVNVLVGDQGCGKSTVLEALVSHSGSKKSFWKRSDESKKSTILDFVPNSGLTGLFAHDFECDSPRVSPSFDMMGQIPMTLSVQCMRMSHGQSGNKILEVVAGSKNAIIILDEPDSGLSPKSIRNLILDLKTMESNGCQVIVSAHNPWLIEAFDEVLSIEGRRWMTSKEYLRDCG